MANTVESKHVSASSSSLSSIIHQQTSGAAKGVSCRSAVLTFAFGLSARLAEAAELQRKSTDSSVEELRFQFGGLSHLWRLHWRQVELPTTTYAAEQQNDTIPQSQPTT
jgi:hypothetical protein